MDENTLPEICNIAADLTNITELLDIVSDALDTEINGLCEIAGNGVIKAQTAKHVEAFRYLTMKIDKLADQLWKISDISPKAAKEA